MCYHNDEAVRHSARSKLKSYVEKTMCASFGSDYKVSHVCENDAEREDTVENTFQSLPEQVTQDARHKDHCYSVRGESVLPVNCIHFLFEMPLALSSIRIKDSVVNGTYMAQ